VPAVTGYGRRGEYAYVYGHENGELIFLKIATEGKVLYKFEKDKESIFNILDEDGEQLLTDLLENKINKKFR
jgi:hypothetical protein